MHITSQQQLKKQRRKLSIIFTLILFAVVTGLQIVFSIWRYLDYTNREIQNIENQIFPKHKLQQNSIKDAMIVNTPPMPMFGKDERGRRLKWGNVILYDVNNQSIISSSLWDNEFTQDILKELLQEDEDRWTIIYNKTKFLFLKQKTNQTLRSFFLLPIHMQISDIVRDSLLFIWFFWICSLLFYYIIYWFVGKIFLPIEENMQDMEQFIFNAGHELKTPLSVIKSHLQLALAKKQYKKAIDESIQEVNKMNNLIESLVNLSMIKIDSDNEELEIGQEVEWIVLQYLQIAKKNGIKIEIKKKIRLFCSCK